MPTTRPIVKFNDPRTGKKYAVLVDPDCPQEVMVERMRTQAEHDYQKTLPPERRTVANQPTNFACPHCKTHEKPTSRKVTTHSSGLFWSRTDIVDVFLCGNCGREFTEQELSRAQNAAKESNYYATLLERYKDGEIGEDVIISATRA